MYIFLNNWIANYNSFNRRTTQDSMVEQKAKPGLVSPQAKFDLASLGDG